MACDWTIETGSRIVAGGTDVLVEPGLRPRVRSTLRRGVPIYWDGAMARRAMPAGAVSNG